MGQISTDQSQEVMATLMANTSWSLIDFEEAELQDAILRNPLEAGKKFTDFLNNIAKNQRQVCGNDYLRCILNKESLTIPACDGARIIANAKNVFPGYIDDNFRKLKADEAGTKTLDTVAHVFELTRKANFVKMFNIKISNLTHAGLSDFKRLNKMIYTQDQIIGFVESHRNWLRTDGHATFFLFKSYGNFFVAVINFSFSGRLKVSVVRFWHSLEWSARAGHRVVVPWLV